MHSHESTRDIRELHLLLFGGCTPEEWYETKSRQSPRTVSENEKRNRVLVLDHKTNKLSVRYKDSEKTKKY